MIDLNKLAAEIHAAAVGKGFWDVEDAAEKHVAKMHSELSEAVQADRAGIMYEIEREGAKPEGVAAELADFVMMALDLLAREDFEMDEIFMHVHKGIRRSEKNMNLARESTLPALVNNVHKLVSNAVYGNKLDALAVAVIVVDAWLHVRGHDLWEIIRQKMDYNKSRPKLHGRAY